MCNNEFDPLEILALCSFNYYVSGMRRFATQSHLRSRIDARAPAVHKTAAFLNAKAAMKRGSTSHSEQNLADPTEVVNQAIVRSFNFPITGWDGSYLYPSESALNFTPVRSVNPALPGALDRAVREVPWESKQGLLRDRLIRPEFASECKGTPRREFQGGMIGGVRVRAVANPYFVPTGQKRKQFDRWRSRNLEAWNPSQVAVRGGTRLYSVPDDIVPKKDELGEWREPTLSGRYQADIKRQYAMHGLPWIYRRDFMVNKMHILDKEPIGPKRWYRREYRQAKIREAMRNMGALVEEYRKERQAAKKKTWFEQIVHKLVGAQTASKYITERKLPKI